MASADGVLDAAERLAAERGELPSLGEIAKAMDLTKQGVLHYFPTRAALDAAVVRRALSRVDAVMRTAASEGSPLEAYLRMSSPTDDDHVVVSVLMAALKARGSSEVLTEVQSAVVAWEELIAEELGDPVVAAVARLTCDGLFSQALFTGVVPSPARIDDLLNFFRAAASDTRR
jgi:AcrR family transcriptional regulator